MRNVLVELREVLGLKPLQIGEVTAYADGQATVELPGGGVIQVRGVATIGDNVFIRGNVIEGLAPALTPSSIDI